MPIQPGTDIGRYHILEQLGEGGMAVVYKAYDTQLEREVALKVLMSGQGSNDKFIKRFKLEAKALAKLNHPNIVKILDYGEQDGLPYLVMEYVPGQTLKQKVGKPMEYKQAASLLAPIADALAYAHEHKILHRDVKPSNILIKEDGTPLLSDFGIAKMLELDETLDLTGTGVGMGTPEYMAPELGLGEPGNEKADQYSLGIVFYELVTGRKPFRADTPVAILIKQATEPLPSLKQFNNKLPESVERVLFKALAKNPKDRFTNITDFTNALKQLAQGEKVGVGRVASQQKNKQNLAIIVIVAAIFFMILILTSFFTSGKMIGIAESTIDLVKAATLQSEATAAALKTYTAEFATKSSYNQTQNESTPSSTMRLAGTIVCTTEDNNGDANPGYYDITNATLTFDENNFSYSIFLKEALPSRLIVNTNSEGSVENSWGVYIDVDGNPNTGTTLSASYDQRSQVAQGIEYEANVFNFSKGSSNQQIQKFEDAFTARITKWEGSSGDNIANGIFSLDEKNKSINFSAAFSGLSLKSKFYFYSLCLNTSCDYNANFDTAYEVICKRQ